jgi:hypothetical protein
VFFAALFICSQEPHEIPERSLRANSDRLVSRNRMRVSNGVKRWGPEGSCAETSWIKSVIVCYSS